MVSAWWLPIVLAAGVFIGMLLLAILSMLRPDAGQVQQEERREMTGAFAMPDATSSKFTSGHPAERIR